MLDEIHYQRLKADNFTGHSLDDFVRHQTVTECWRKIDNDWKLVPNVYEENWSQTQCREIASGSLGLRLSPIAYSELRQDMCSWFVFRYQRNTDAMASAGSFFQWLVKRHGGWAQINYTFQHIPQKSRRRHTGHLAVPLRRRSMRDWQQRSPLMSKWNTDYKRV